MTKSDKRDKGQTGSKSAKSAKGSRPKKSKKRGYPFDATFKNLFRKNPNSYLRFVLSTLTNTDPQQIGTLNLRVMDVDVSTVSTSLDFVVGLWTEKSLSDIFAFDFQAGYDPNLNTNVLKRNVVLFSQFLCPVHSAVIMLSRKALHPDLNGRVFYGAND